jgi:hypothetical protein
VREFNHGTHGRGFWYLHIYTRVLQGGTALCPRHALAICQGLVHLDAYFLVYRKREGRRYCGLIGFILNLSVTSCMEQYKGVLTPLGVSLASCGICCETFTPREPRDLWAPRMVEVDIMNASDSSLVKLRKKTSCIGGTASIRWRGFIAEAKLRSFGSRTTYS